MRFALLGNHPDGLAVAGALVDSGRHQLVAVSAGLDLDSLVRLSGAVRQVHAEGVRAGSAVLGVQEQLGHLTPASVLDDDALHRLGGPRRASDVEEVLADPAIEAVIVAGPPSARLAQLRRALQSERPVLCVHPADEKPDGAYEAAMLQADTGKPLVPILPEGMHPALARLAEFIDREGAKSPLGAFRLLQFERHARGELLEGPEEGLRPAIPGWDVLRRLGGEVAEVSAFAEGEELEAGRPVLLHGRFSQGGLFQVTQLPTQPRELWRLAIIGDCGQAELIFPQGADGPAFLEWQEPDGERHEEDWPRWDPWPAVVETFEAAQANASASEWLNEVRALELDDAARTSAAKRRAQQLEYQEASEEVGFKGTMSLVGCSLLWGVLLLLIASRWLPWIGWLILPMLLVFIAVQLLRYVIPRKPR
jgi:predicted dehydrogenase